MKIKLNLLGFGPKRTLKYVQNAILGNLTQPPLQHMFVTVS